MKKVIGGLLLYALLVPGQTQALQRVVLVEEFTATWCPPCKPAALGLHDLKQIAGDTLSIIAYHLSDAFTVMESSMRQSYYGVDAIPWVWFDGVLNVKGASGNMLPTYKARYDARKIIDSPTLYTLSGTYNSSSRNGEINISLQNTGSSTIIGYLRTAIVLLDTPYVWQGLPELEWVLRDMVPSANGLPYTIEPGQNINTVVSFKISSADAENKVQFVVFFQRDDTKEVYGAATIDLPDFTWIRVAEKTKEEKGYTVKVRRENKGYRFFINNPEGKNSEIVFYNVDGRKIFAKILHYAKNSFFFQSNSGVYFYKIEQENKIVQTGKIITF